MRWKLMLPILVLGWTGTIAASNVDSISTAGQIFSQTSGARAEGLGGCGTLLGEANSGLYNPAAQVLMDDIAASVFYNPRPYFARGRDFVVASAAAHSDFGYTGFNFLTQTGLSNSDDFNLRPENATSLLIAGRAWRNLAAGVGFKILTTQKNQFTQLGGSWINTYKMAFDLGVIYSSFLPQSTLGRVNPENDTIRKRFGRKIVRGFTLGVAFQNLGGSVNYSDVYTLPLPQTFRADAMWTAFSNRWANLIVTGEEQKILVQRDPVTLGYSSATHALFYAWSSGDLEGSWISRLGLEATLFSLVSLRMGWSVDHGADQAFNHVGLGLGPQWLRADLAWIHQPGSGLSWSNGFRMDLSANLTYEKVRRWMNKD